MDLSKPKHDSVDEDYWKHGDLEGWDSGCRIKHGESTWYTSFMGRNEKQQAWEDAKKGRRQD